jgi:putative spermidine/putrescine transport system ATP-binding protein
LTFLGPSGSGKTTTLMMIAGFETPDEGRILYYGVSIANLPPHKRNIGVVFQNYALFPHMSVADNVAFPLKLRRTPRPELTRRVKRALDMIELGAFADRLPNQLSGGQQQRVALARALVFEPKLILMDEPLGALDRRLRETMQLEIKRLHRELNLTVVYVTHDQTEAMILSDRVAVFRRGRIEQLAPPRVIHERPANGFVARFVGDTNIFAATLVEAAKGGRAHARTANGLLLSGLTDMDAPSAAPVLVSVRPERISLDPAGGDNQATGIAIDAAYFGDHVTVRIKLDAGGEVDVNLGIGGADDAPKPGKAVTLSWRAEHTLLLDPAD